MVPAPAGAGGSTGPALLIVGHGTRDEAGAEQFRRFVDRVRRRAGGVAVDGGFIELSAPPVADAVRRLVDAGHHRLGVVPLTLVAAGHAKGDIPGSMARERERHPGLRYAYGRPLGPHPTILRLLADRVDALCPAGQRERTMVLLVGRGSTDPDANAEVFKVARLLWEGRGYAGVEVAFISLAEPSVPAGLERIVRLGGRRIVVVPYFLFTGVLPRRTVEQATGWAAGRAEVELACAGLLGDPDPNTGTGGQGGGGGLVELVVERYREALGGDIRMNCDTCLYRIALPGHAHRVGQAQTPHDHPDDPSHSHGPGHGHGPHAAHPVG
ncbi:sirohydrochlorin chelatase [Parafrankia discariae]|uniref:sirohydrochlorin chelatase n=1 Tax=Parafrankia discariae TaxID=365528 RepID=UPI0006874BD4